MRRSSRRNPKAAKPAAAATAPRRLRWRWRQRNSLNRAASRNDRVLRRIRSPGVACDLASSGAGVTPCLCAAHGSGESCFSVASLSLSLLPSVSPSFALYFSQADDCDYVKPRLRRRPSEAEPAEGTKEGGEGRRKRGRGRRRRGRAGEAGSDIALPFRRQTVFYAARDRAITSSRRRLHRKKYVVRARALARDRRTN